MADIVIRGMEMPDGCHKCRFQYLADGETNDGKKCTVVMCSAKSQGTNEAVYDGNRPSWCPLVPLPEGHGDLIEKKSAKARFCQFCFWKHQIEDACERCAGCPIDFIQTIVPAEGEVNEDG